MDEVKGTLTIVPLSKRIFGKSYAIYVNGNVNVNRTIQGPISAHNKYFDITIPFFEFKFENEAPQISQFKDTIEIYPLGTNPELEAKQKSNIYTVGVP